MTFAWCRRTATLFELILLHPNKRWKSAHNHVMTISMRSTELAKAIRRTAILAFTLLLAAPALAAVPLSERSPFAQGHWWDPAHSGSGFDIFNANGQVGLVWFTYDESGRSIWYTAGGAVDTMGAQAWPLLKHRWSNGRKQDPTVVGSLRLRVNHSESADLSWDVGGKQGTWTIQPLIVSGVVNEFDHSGHWFNPNNSGWGFSLVEQGDVLGGALFTYDTTGEPTWVSGFQRGSTSVEYLAFRGACPWCTYQTPTSSNVGKLSFDFSAETQLTVRNSLSLPMAAGVSVDGASVVQLGRAASKRPADRQLASFDADAAVKAYLDAGMLNIASDYSTTSFSPAPPSSGASFSPTNLQEAGVDEADVTKSDGRFVYTFAYGSNGMRLPAVRVAMVGSEGAALVVLGSVPLTSSMAGSAGLFLYADKLIAVTGSQAYSYIGPAWMSSFAWVGGSTVIEVMDASGPGLPVTRWRAEIEGNVVSSRRIGSRLYVVSRYAPRLDGFTYGATMQPQLTANQQLLARTPLSAVLPKVRVDGGAATMLVGPASIFAPPQGSRKPMADMIVITAIDLDQPRIAQSMAIIGTVDTVYASTTNLFVATSRYPSVYANAALIPPEPPYFLTDIHQVRLAANAMTIVGSASIEGHLGTDPDKASFRLSEYQNRLRAVTSSPQMWGTVDQNRLTILEPSTVAPGLLKTLSYLPNKARPQTLGKPYEVLYSTRFLGDRLYAVTFKKIDPLYVVDIADSTDPRIAGALEVPGFSDYLHPLPNGLLLGFGKDAKPAVGPGDGQFAWYQGLQLSLYDVRDVGQPREVQRVTIGKRGSDSALLRDHHAFSALMRSDGTGSFAIPARINDGPYPEYGSGDSAYYPWQQSGLMRFELRGTSATDAQIVQMPSLTTHRAPQGYFIDPAISAGRSVLFPNGTIYVGNGQFWRQDLGGNVFGPL